MSIAHAFDTVASRYDQERAALVPYVKLFYSSAVAELDALPAQAPRILDLGAGTGLMARMAATAFPRAQFTLIDVAADMLDVARRHFSEAGRDVICSIANYAVEPLGGPYDAIISALSIHHLEHEAKQRLYSRIVEALVPGGIFVNADQVLAPSPTLEMRYATAWERHAVNAGATPETLASAKDRMSRFDRCATLSDQLSWMGEAGLADVDCWWKWGAFAVMSGRKPA